MSPNDATASASSSSSSAIRQDSQYIGGGDAIKINYEVFLPIVFALAFMLMLFLVYVCNNVDVRGLLRRRCCCCRFLWKKKKKNTSNKLYNPRVRSTSQHAASSKPHSHQDLPNVNLNNYAKSHELFMMNEDDETKKRVEDFRAIKSYRRSQNVYASALNAHMPMQAAAAAVALSMPSHQKFVNHPNAGFGNLLKIYLPK